MRDQARKAKLAISDMLDEIENTQAALAEFTFEQFASSFVHRRAAERSIETISEASRRIPDDLKETEPEIPWTRVAGIETCCATTMTMLRRGQSGMRSRTTSRLLKQRCAKSLSESVASNGIFPHQFFSGKAVPINRCDTSP